IIRSLSRDLAKRPEGRTFEPEYLSIVGFAMPVTVADHAALVGSQLLALLNDNAKLLSVADGRHEGDTVRIVEIETNTGRRRLTLDPSKGFALRLCEEFTVAGLLAARTRCRAFANLPGTNCWLPHETSVEHYWLPSMGSAVEREPVYVDTFSIEHVDTAPVASASFDLSSLYMKPGAAIADARLLSRLPAGSPDRE